MAQTPDRIVVRLDVPGAGEAFLQMLRQGSRTTPTPAPPPSLWRRALSWWRGKS